MSYLRLIYAVALAFALSGAATAASAASDSSQLPRSMTIRYGDLSLDRPGDVVRLYGRIRAAADRVCGPREVTGSRLPRRSYARCFDAAIEHAVADVASPALSAYYYSLPAVSASRRTTVAQR